LKKLFKFLKRDSNFTLQQKHGSSLGQFPEFV
jgi:hypothetical protein